MITSHHKLILKAEFGIFVPKGKKDEIVARCNFTLHNPNTNQNLKAKVVSYGKFTVLSESAIIFDSYKEFF